MTPRAVRAGIAASVIPITAFAAVVTADGGHNPEPTRVVGPAEPYDSHRGDNQ